MDPKEKNNVQYPFALDEDNKRVFVGDINKDHRHDHTYKCPCCGEPMLPRLGDHKAKHFYHSGNQSCGKESYIHAVAKGILADRFNNRQKPFMIKFWNSYFCNKKKTCKWFDQCLCEDSQLIEYDLHDYYDRPARKEIWLKNTSQDIFRPDVVLESSKWERNPLYIEVYHKHKCSDKKIQSGNLIIEIRVKDFDELVSLQDLELEQSERVNFRNFKDMQKRPEWFKKAAEKRAQENGFKPTDYDLPVCFRSRDGQREYLDRWRTILYRSGKTYSCGIFEEEINNHEPNALADITFSSKRVPQSFNARDVLISYLPKQLRSCFFCCHIAILSDETNFWCELVQNGSKRKGTFNEKKGQYCSSFECNEGKDPVDSRMYSIWINPHMH